ncbi:hypothetical protein E2C01_074072 [Portunus trituberculatus]|uniref:Uncharacterized protein n=1 Tax=Portunus trituberculatus TaxID=210409 RepID=A0A5B7IB82_PORTR|nr:hypothetical protein [Portunus trituberculatus]
MLGDSKLWQLCLPECERRVPWLVTGVAGAWRQVWSDVGGRCGPSSARGVPRVATAADTLMVGATYSPLITSAGFGRGHVEGREGKTCQLRGGVVRT